MSYGKYLEILKNRKKKLTPGRKKIIKIFCLAKNPLSAKTLIEKTGLNKTSIYREISFLLSQDFIQDVDFADRIKRHELKDRKHHHHLVCLKCKKVSDVILEENLNNEETRIEKNKDFKIVKHHLEFFGYCKGCWL